jgi:hypothetical protein
MWVANRRAWSPRGRGCRRDWFSTRYPHPPRPSARDGPRIGSELGDNRSRKCELTARSPAGRDPRGAGNAPSTILPYKRLIEITRQGDWWMTEKEVRSEILEAIIECMDEREVPVVTHVDSAKRLRDAVFDALAKKGVLGELTVG